MENTPKHEETPRRASKRFTVNLSFSRYVLFALQIPGST